MSDFTWKGRDGDSSSGWRAQPLDTQDWRCFEVPQGWLYQVARTVLNHRTGGLSLVWSEPVFVPAPPRGYVP